MRNLLLLVVFCLGGFWVYHRYLTPDSVAPHSDTASPSTSQDSQTVAAAGKFALPDPVAWKQIWNNPGHPMEHVQVILMDGDRWRVEERELSSSKIFVLIFDGTTFVSTNPKVTTKPVGSGPVMQASLSFLNGIKPLGTETRDGRSCLLFEMPPDAQSAKSRMWVDSQSHFPVVLDAWSPQGALTEMHFQLLKSDFSILSPKCFDIHNTAPMLTPLLTL